MGNFQTLVQGAPIELLAQLAAGGVGGNLAGAALRSFSLGPFWNSVAGFLGGIAGAQGLLNLGVIAADSHAGVLSAPVIAGGIGGAAFIILLGLIRSMSVR
jgi:hypothetical protein